MPFPAWSFTGEVGKVRLNATMTQNVVTYTVEVNTDNADGKLLPYLTANVKFIVGEQQGRPLVPNAALRWEPQPDQIVAEFRQSPKKAEKAATRRGGKAGRPGQQGEAAPGSHLGPRGQPGAPGSGRLGLSDGSPDGGAEPRLKEGTPVVVGELEKTGAAEEPAPAAAPLPRKSCGGRQSAK